MCFHFDNRELAVAHLTTNGWSEIKNGAWVSRDKTCAAHILTLRNSDVVMIQAWEVE